MTIETEPSFLLIPLVCTLGGLCLFVALVVYSCEADAKRSLEQFRESHRKCALAYQAFPPHVVYEKCGAPP